MSERGRNRRLREEETRKKRGRKKRRTVLVVFATLFVCLAAAAGGYCIYDRMMDAKTMGCRISVYGENVSWLTVEDAAQKLNESFAGTEIVFEENGEQIYRTTLGQAGYSLDQEKLLQELTALKNNREPCKIIFEEYKDSQIDYQIQRQEDRAAEVFSKAHLDTGTVREASADAYIKYDGEQGQFVIIPDVLGTQIDEEKLQEKTRTVLEESFSRDLLKKSITVEVGEDVYQQAEVVSTTEALVNRLTELNGKLENYPKATVTYTFGSAEEVLDSDTIRSWMVIMDDDVTLDEEAIRSYVQDLGNWYNTMYIPRYLETSDGSTVEISNNEYGYWIDEDGEFEQLKLDLENGEPVTREPIYSHEGLGRDGRDDLLGSYVEISLEKQHLWLYKDGQLITETDVVTGQPVGVNKTTGETEDWSTLKGAYPIAYMESPSVLSSDIYGYETEVQYWMPFVEGQGLHDASWKSSFGGQIYQTDGSHGCVNLPVDQAALIYSYVETGYAVLIY